MSASMNLTRSVTCNAVVIALLIVSTVIIIWGTGPAPHTDEGPLRSFGSMDHTSRQHRLDAIIVLMGGQTKPDGGVPVWVARRLDRAVELQRSQSEPLPPIVCSGAGTGAVPPVLTPEKFIMHEATSATKYLHDTWDVDFSLLMKEWSSYDTEGNAYFTLVQFAIPAGWRRIAIVTSEFHMPRSKALFEWIFGLQGASAGHSHLQAPIDASKHDPRSQGYLLEYHSVSDEGLEEQALKNRLALEEELIEKVINNAKRIHTLQEFHHHFFAEKSYYSTAKQHMFGKEKHNHTGLY